MGFANSVVGGAKKLIREAIESTLYVAGVSGWAIRKDGSAEFNSATIRGLVEVGPASPGARISVSGTANIPAALSGFSADFVWTAAIIEWFNGTDFYFMAIGTYVGGGGPFPVEAKGTYDTVNSVLFEEIIQKTSISFVLHGSAVYNSIPSNWIYRNGSVTIDTIAGCDFNFDGFSGPRAYVGGAFFTQAGIVASSAGAEVAIAAWDANSSASVTLKNGRFYGIRATFGIANRNAGASNQIAIVRLRQAVNSIVATELGRATIETIGFDQVTTRQITFRVFNTSGADVGITPGLTIQRQTGANNHILYGDANLTTSLEVFDLGRAIDVGPMTFYCASVV